MGEVYRAVAEGAHGFSRQVAVKLLLPQLAEQPEAVTVFLREALFAGRLRHPNIVSVIDAGIEQGRPWLAMELVEGVSISNLLSKAHASGQMIPLGVVSCIGLAVLDALSVAHAAVNESGQVQPIVHRDISPQNILIGFDGFPRLIDFGIAQALGATRFTAEGVVKGKFAYIAPEQVEGRASPQTDLYSLGLVLWELISGRPAINRSTPLEMLSQVMHKPIQPVRSVRADVPEALSAALERALAKNPLERWSTAARFASALEAAVSPASTAFVRAWVADLRGTPGDPKGRAILPTPSARASPFPIRRRFVWVAMGGALWAAGFVGGRFDSGGRFTEPVKAEVAATHGWADAAVQLTLAPPSNSVEVEPSEPERGPAATPAEALRTKAKRTKKNVSSSDSGANCQEQFFVDSLGIKRYRIQCLEP
jgi:serine/threonine protein kinase